MFRHIAIGRRNWLHSGSHFAASNIGFMYSLLVSKGLLTKDEGRLYSRLLQHRITGDYNDLIIL